MPGDFKLKYYPGNRALRKPGAVSGNFTSDTKTMTAIQSNIKAKFIIKAILFCVVFTGLFIILSLTKGFFPNNPERIAHGMIGTVAALLATFLFLKFDRKKFSDIGLVFQRNTIANFLVGIVVGVTLMGALALSVLYLTNASVEVNRASNILHFLLMTLPLLPLAFMEELGFRAYPVRILEDKVGIRWTILITSILFALYHIANGWTVASSFYGPAVWGLVFGLAAIYSKGIAMPTGIHYAANLTTSAFGAGNTAESIWTVKHAVPATPNGIDWTAVLPFTALFAFAIICIELYVRRKTVANGTLAKGVVKEQSIVR